MLLEVLHSATDWTWLLTILVGLLTFALVKHILNVRSLPPGPFPLPVLGNILSLRGKGNEPKSVFERLAKKHKDIYTIWLGSKPTVMVCSWDLCKKALTTMRNDFSGRFERHSTSLFLDGTQDVAFGDYGPSWEVMRKIMHSAIRKYAVSEKLAVLVADVVDNAVEHMLKQGNKPLDSREYNYLIIYNVLASSTFGTRFDLNDPVFVNLRTLNNQLNEAIGIGLPSDALPMLKWFYMDRINRITAATANLRGYIGDRYSEHKKTYREDVVRDFTDAVIAARLEAEKEASQKLEYLTDGNLVSILLNVFAAGTDTTRIAVMWIILMMCEKPEVQKKMVAEIDENIGFRIATQDDRDNCPYTYAVVTEILRFRSVIDFTLEHKTTCNTEIAGYKIPKDTSCLFHLVSSHHDPENFIDPEEFKPERFLLPDGRFNKDRKTGYMPFGLGRRACPGEKMALADVFFIVVRLLQRCSFELELGPGGVSLEPSRTEFGNFPVPYNFFVKPRNFPVSPQ